MDQYNINFKLLVPRLFILRYDILPFLILYSILFYCYYTFQDSGNTYIYIRLTFVAIGFINCLAYIFGHWSKRVQAIIQYKVIQGDIGNNLLKASHVFISEKIPGYANQYGISDLFLQQLESQKNFGEPAIYFFYFHQRKFYYDKDSKKFVRLKPKINNNPICQILDLNQNLNTQPYDDNILQIPIRPFSDIFKDQIVDPFQFFQLFSVLLWMLDENGGYSLFILLMLIFSAYTISLQRIKTLVGFRSMTLAPHEVKVFREGKWNVISSFDLKPGDITIVEAGYQHKKTPYETISDEQYLAQKIPFGSKLPTNVSKQSKKAEDKTSHKSVSCDILLLNGTCIANQSILTGEAVPQVKESLLKSDYKENFDLNKYKHNILFCGTEVLQINENLNPQESKNIFKDVSLTNLPTKGCLGIVLATGFDTSKGKLIRKVVSNTQSLRLQEKDGLWIILFLLICSLFTSAYVLDQGMGNEERSKEKLFLRCILIITTVVPPQLPMILTLTVNNSILQLQKKRIFVSEPKKIPIGGKINTIAFDKTGTLTEDKFIFEGIVDDCSDFKVMKKFNNCRHENCLILSGCHSLISVDQQLSGDPIQLMFFESTSWTFTSKNKEARKGLERIMIKKVYPFRSELKRMSTVAEHIPEKGKTSLKVLVKGAPESIQALLSEIPKNYVKAYTHYTKQGYRLLALAYKIIERQEFESMDKEFERDYLQKGLIFSGFFICSSPLKEDTMKNIKHLQKAQYNLKIITGDNILTAIKVGTVLSMGEQPYTLESVDDKLILSHVDQQVQIKSVKQLKQKISSGEQLVCTSTAKNIDPQYYPFIAIFARTSPQDKEVIVKKLKQFSKNQGGGILYAGDGTNDMGGLRVADVGVAVIGTTTITEQQKKQQQFKEQQRIYKQKMRELQSDIGMPFRRKMQVMKNLTAQYSTKKRQNAMGIFSEDEVKVGDACFAAPFTSKHSNSIKCVLIILRQAIATLVTTIQTYKILAISSMIQAYSLAEMNLTNLKYSQSQTLVVGILASINLYYFSNAKPLSRISHIRAPHTIFNIWFAISFFGQIIIFIASNYYALNYIGLKYLLEEDRNISADAQFQKSFVNTVIFLFSAISQSAVFISNHGGQPHMQSLLKNGRQFKFLVIPLAFCFVVTANFIPDLSYYFDLKFDGISYDANIEMLVVFGFMVVSTYLLERLCRFGQFKQFVGWF